MMAIKWNRFHRAVLIVIATLAVYLCFINYKLLKSEARNLQANVIGNVSSRDNSYIWSFYKHIKGKLQNNDLPSTLKADGDGDSTADCSNKYLVGRLEITANVTVDEVTNTNVLQNVRYGGLYRPSDCKPQKSVAVILPYRDRHEHLTIFLHYIHAFLQRQRLEYGIFVVEMALPTQFNRGLLANIGFENALSIKSYDCIVIHDVDLLPLDDRNSYTCSTNPRHLSVNNRKFQREKHMNGLPYNSYTGGVLGMSTAAYQKINGFSNLFFGWGGEDDDVGIRFDLIKTVRQRMHKDGLKNLQYIRLAMEFRDLYTWIYVKADEAKIMQSAIDAKIIQS